MSSISKPNTFSPNTTISSSQMNDNFDTIYDEFNGNISEANLANSAVTADKVASSAITAAKIADDAVTAAKVDWASTGSGAGIWWEELGRTTLGSAGDSISVTSIPARKYLLVYYLAINSGQLTPVIRFNNDSGNNYASRYSSNGGADAATTPGSSIVAGTGSVPASAIGDFFIVNVAAVEKLVQGLSTHLNAAGSGNTPGRLEISAKWANTADQITRIDLINTGTGDFATGSELVVLGHN